MFHTIPTMFALVTFAPKPGAPDHARVMCYPTPEGDAMLTYLSPFDAWIEATYSSKPGTPYRVIDASTFDPREMVSDLRGKLNVGLHIGWTASDGKLLAKPSGELVGYMALQTLAVAPADMEDIEFTLNVENRKSVDTFHEKAGLFAYSESLEASMKWGDHRLDREVALAMQNVPATCEASSADINQIAVYDLEGKQWHFVALADLVDKTTA
ncbi:hypothetical protein BSU04_06340 [Caballeronia sordidicola]|uniref:Uncharacterized protein n=1 Tax=Caballeronia sordidicola TaxID=196367 RepID=A0A226X9B2_CABSO|nr:hypothetical protein BSU04_06340 [Caballeronia sordidicola]